MGYFRELPDLQYQSPYSTRISSTSYVTAKNIFRRMKLRDDLKNVFTLFNKRFIEEGERPDTVAEKEYGKSDLDWVVLLSAGIINVRNEDQINFATSVFGSGPAFIAYILNIFVKASKKLAKPYHMNEKEVIELFKNVLETNHSSKMLDDFVKSISSKKGTTEAGVNYIKSQNIEKIIYTTLLRAYKRSKEIDSEKKNTKS